MGQPPLGFAFVQRAILRKTPMVRMRNAAQHFSTESFQAPPPNTACQMHTRKATDRWPSACQQPTRAPAQQSPDQASNTTFPSTCVTAASPKLLGNEFMGLYLTMNVSLRSATRRSMMASSRPLSHIALASCLPPQTSRKRILKSPSKDKEWISCTSCRQQLQPRLMLCRQFVLGDTLRKYTKSKEVHLVLLPSRMMSLDLRSTGKNRCRQVLWCRWLNHRLHMVPSIGKKCILSLHLILLELMITPTKPELEFRAVNRRSKLPKPCTDGIDMTRLEQITSLVVNVSHQWKWAKNQCVTHGS